MITIPELTAQALGSFLARETEGRFRSSHSDLTKLLPFAARLALECIGNSDALYHNIEHTMLVTLVGHDILSGRALQRTTTAPDYANFIIACLTHDIGYVRGIVQGDEDGGHRLVICCTPAHEIAIGFHQLKRIDGPVGAQCLNDIEMRKKQ